MASRKDLKKTINASMDMMYVDCVLYKVFVKDANIAKADEVITLISEKQTELVNRLSASEGKEVKTRTKAYYKKLRNDLKEQVEALSKEIQGLN